MDMETKDLSFVDVPQLKQYVSKHSKQTVLANKAVKEYLANYDKWKEIVGYTSVRLNFPERQLNT